MWFKDDNELALPCQTFSYIPLHIGTFKDLNYTVDNIPKKPRNKYVMKICKNIPFDPRQFHSR